MKPYQLDTTFPFFKLYHLSNFEKKNHFSVLPTHKDILICYLI